MGVTCPSGQIISGHGKLSIRISYHLFAYGTVLEAVKGESGSLHMSVRSRDRRV